MSVWMIPPSLVTSPSQESATRMKSSFNPLTGRCSAGLSSLLVLMLGAVSSPPCLAGNAELDEEGRNEAAFFVGGTAEDGVAAITLGAEYERRITERWGINVISEHVDISDAWIFLAPITFRPWSDRGLKLYFGPGVETKEREPEEENSIDEDQPELAAEPASPDGRQTLLVLRTGLSWTFAARSLLITPQVEVDLGREPEYWEPAVVFGVGVGFEFRGAAGLERPGESGPYSVPGSPGGLVRTILPQVWPVQVYSRAQT